MGSLGSAFFMGWVVSSLILPAYSDKYGRKIVVFLSTFIAALSTIGLLFSNSL